VIADYQNIAKSDWWCARRIDIVRSWLTRNKFLCELAWRRTYDLPDFTKAKSES
jgi:hypothetical protein